VLTVCTKCSLSVRSALKQDTKYWNINNSAPLVTSKLSKYCWSVWELSFILLVKVYIPSVSLEQHFDTNTQIHWKFIKGVNPDYISKIWGTLFVFINFSVFNALLKHNKVYEGE